MTDKSFSDTGTSIFSQTPLILKSYWLYRQTAKQILKFPKPYRYCLGEKLQTSILNIIDLTAQALYSRQPLKEPIILRLLGAIQAAQLFIRLSHDEQLISEYQLFAWSDQIAELNRMAAGWLASVRSPGQPKIH